MYLGKFRKKLNLTQRELSEILEIAQTAIARYENDKVKPTSAVIQKYIDKLNANPFFLFTGVEPYFLDEQQNINKQYIINKKKLELEKLESELNEIK